MSAPPSKEVEFRTVSVLPYLAWEMLPDSPHRSFVVKVRDDTGKQVFRNPRFGLDSR